MIDPGLCAARDGAETVCVDGAAHQAGRAQRCHVLRREHGVDHGLFDRLGRRKVDRIELFVADRLERAPGARKLWDRSAIGGAEGQGGVRGRSLVEDASG